MQSNVYYIMTMQMEVWEEKKIKLMFGLLAYQLMTYLNICKGISIGAPLVVQW